MHEIRPSYNTPTHVVSLTKEHLHASAFEHTLQLTDPHVHHRLQNVHTYKEKKKHIYQTNMFLFFPHFIKAFILQKASYECFQVTITHHPTNPIFANTSGKLTAQRRATAIH